MPGPLKIATFSCFLRLRMANEAVTWYRHVTTCWKGHDTLRWFLATFGRYTHTVCTYTQMIKFATNFLPESCGISSQRLIQGKFQCLFYQSVYFHWFLWRKSSAFTILVLHVENTCAEWGEVKLTACMHWATHINWFTVYLYKSCLHVTIFNFKND